MNILVVPGVALAALSIWLMVHAINRHPRWRPSTRQFRVGAAILVVVLPWWILAIVVWFAWTLVVSDFRLP